MSLTLRFPRLRPLRGRTPLLALALVTLRVLAGLAVLTFPS